MRTMERFIVFEGIDGSGKGTQLAMLKQRLGDRDDVVFTVEHTRKGEWSEQLENILHRRVVAPPAKDIQMLFILDRRDHVRNEILPALRAKKTVICDRYMLSTLAYGSLDPTLHWKTLLEMHEELLGEDFIIPEVTLFIDTPVDVALERINTNRDSVTLFEAREKLRIVVDSYRSVGPHIPGFIAIDGEGGSDAVFERVCKILPKNLGL